MNSVLKKTKDFFTKDIVFTVAFAMAVATSFLNVPRLKYIDFKVIITLWSLMLLIKAYEKYKALDFFAITLLNKCNTQRKLTLAFICITFFLSMLITNDVALLTFVPLAIIISKKSSYDVMYPVILITIAANLGSAMTPMGNPQNLYIYSFYELSALDFFKVVLPMTVVGFVILLILNFFNREKILEFKIEKVEIIEKKRFLITTVIFLFTILSVFKIVDYRLAFVFVLLYALFFDRELIKKVDYRLLLTFICFFIAIGNISALDSVSKMMKELIGQPQSTYLSGILLSQFISNVPCTILLSPFTEFYDMLLLGVNIGGLGTIIASLASVISYRIYANEFQEKSKSFFCVFTVTNVTILTIMGIIFYF